MLTKVESPPRAYQICVFGDWAPPILWRPVDMIAVAFLNSNCCDVLQSDTLFTRTRLSFFLPHRKQASHLRCLQVSYKLGVLSRRLPETHPFYIHKQCLAHSHCFRQVYIQLAASWQNLSPLPNSTGLKVTLQLTSQSQLTKSASFRLLISSFVASFSHQR